MSDGDRREVAIRRWIDVDEPAKYAPALDEIFFEASATQSFPSGAERCAFRSRWLGRYLETYPEWVYLVLASGGDAVGYLLGCLDDPARTPLFADIGYFAALASLTAEYPAQLHVNLAPVWRNRGIGGRLVEAFVADAARAGTPGVHVITSRGMRNMRFYESAGFREAGSIVWNDRELIFLARRLTS